jgi:NAD+ diphosphatase
MGVRWAAGMVDPSVAGGWALLASQEGFLFDANGVLFPREWLKRRQLSNFEEHGLGYFDGEPVFLLQADLPFELPGAHWQGLRQFMMQSDAEQFRMLAYASQIGTWASQHRFCGRCGGRMQRHLGERAMHCVDCGLHQYPRISPSMIVLVSRGDEILLARSPRFVSGMYSALAGFVEPGETVEQCVAREVREEVALEVDNLRYLGSQSWPFPHSLMLGFHAEYAGGSIVPQPGEIEDARWFRIDDLPPLPGTRSIARYLIDLYVARRSGGADPVLPD